MYLSFQFVIFISLGKKNIMMYTTAKWLLFDKILQKIVSQLVWLKETK